MSLISSFRALWSLLIDNQKAATVNKQQKDLLSKPNHESPRPGPFHPHVLISTWFCSGLLPKAPGTWGSLAALPFAWFIVSQWGYTGLAIGVVLVFILGWWSSSAYVMLTGSEDPGEVVIDEVAGQWIVLLAAPLDPIAYAGAFLLFRLFDILKPWPVSFADKSIKGGLGIMLDDVLAGIYGAAILALVLEFF